MRTGTRISAGMLALVGILALASPASAAMPVITVSDVLIVETDVQQSAVFEITLSRKARKTVSLSYTTLDGTAHAPEDYTAMTGVVKFPAGKKRKTVSVPVAGDLAVEQDELFRLELSLPKRATLADDTGEARITDDETPTTIEVTPSTATIDQDGSQQFTAMATYIDDTQTQVDVTSIATWTSNLPTSASVSSTGLASGEDVAGVPEIRASIGTTSDHGDLTVQCRSHSNGIGQFYRDCQPLGTYTLTTATEAAGAFSANPVTQAQCGAGATLANLIYVSDGTSTASWAYSGPNVGHVHIQSGPNAFCPSAVDPMWN